MPKWYNKMNPNTYTNFENYSLTRWLELPLSMPARKLYIFLRMYKHNEGGYAFPGRKRIIKEAHIAGRDIASARQELVDSSLIYFEHKKGNTPHVYFIDVPLGEDTLAELKAKSVIVRPAPKKRVVLTVSSTPSTHSEQEGCTHSEHSTTTIYNYDSTTTIGTHEIRAVENQAVDKPVEDANTDIPLPPLGTPSSIAKEFLESENIPSVSMVIENAKNISPSAGGMTVQDAWRYCYEHNLQPVLFGEQKQQYREWLAEYAKGRMK